MVSGVPGNETSTLSFPVTKRPLCGHFVPGNESAWERNVPVPMNVDEVRFQLPIVQEALTEAGRRGERRPLGSGALP